VGVLCTPQGTSVDVSPLAITGFVGDSELSVWGWTRSKSLNDVHVVPEELSVHERSAHPNGAL
jgi:hypothetical protein